MIEFTEEDRRMIRENNLMLRGIVQYLANHAVNDDFKNFAINVVADAIFAK